MSKVLVHSYLSYIVKKNINIFSYKYKQQYGRDRQYGN